MNEAVKDSQLSAAPQGKFGQRVRKGKEETLNDSVPLFFMYGEDIDLPIVVKVTSYELVKVSKVRLRCVHAAVPELSSRFTICI